MEDDLQSAGLSRERMALFVGPRSLLRPDPTPLFRVPNTPPLKLNRLWALLQCLYAPSEQDHVGTHRHSALHEDVTS